MHIKLYYLDNFRDLEILKFNVRKRLNYNSNFVL